MPDLNLNTVEEAVTAIKNGQMVIVADDEDRENEGDLVCAAEKITPEIINFMAVEGRGLICLSLSSEIADKLSLQLMSPSINSGDGGTAFTVSIDGSLEKGVSTGISAEDRAKTIQLCMQDDTTARDLRRPGHVFPLIARDGGVLERTGQTEASVDLSRLAGLKAGGVICEIVNLDGTMARRDDLMDFSKKHNIPFVTVSQIINYRLKREGFLTRTREGQIETPIAKLKTQAYVERIDRQREHLVFIHGSIEAESSPLVRIHNQCSLHDVLQPLGENKFQKALHEIVKHGSGILIYLGQDNAANGLISQLDLHNFRASGLSEDEISKRLKNTKLARQYWPAAQILRELNINSIKLMTDSSKKVQQLQELDIEVHKHSLDS